MDYQLNGSAQYGDTQHESAHQPANHYGVYTDQSQTAYQGGQSYIQDQHQQQAYSQHQPQYQYGQQASMHAGYDSLAYQTAGQPVVGYGSQYQASTGGQNLQKSSYVPVQNASQVHGGVGAGNPYQLSMALAQQVSRNNYDESAIRSFRSAIGIHSDPIQDGRFSPNRLPFSPNRMYKRIGNRIGASATGGSAQQGGQTQSQAQIVAHPVPQNFAPHAQQQYTNQGQVQYQQQVPQGQPQAISNFTHDHPGTY